MKMDGMTFFANSKSSEGTYSSKGVVNVRARMCMFVKLIICFEINLQLSHLQSVVSTAIHTLPFGFLCL